MFEQTFVEGTGKTNKSWTVLLSFGLQILLITVLIIIPLIYTEVLPKAQLSSTLLAPPPPPPPPPPPAPAPVKVQKVAPRQFDAGRLTAPKTIPKQIAKIDEADQPPPGAVGVTGGVPGGVPGGTMGGVMGGVIGGLSAAPPPPPPPPPPAAEKPKPPAAIRVGGNVQQAKLVRQPKPVYPPLAKQARISGVVRLNAVIAKDGTIQSLNVVSGHPLLQQAALQAVRQWAYQPTTLNGEPVEVITQIDVNFTLSQ